MVITANNCSDYMIGLPRIEKRLFRSIGPVPIRFVLPDNMGASPEGKNKRLTSKLLHWRQPLSKKHRKRSSVTAAVSCSFGRERPWPRRVAVGAGWCSIWHSITGWIVSKRPVRE
jgi:hypothetical protein